MIKVGSEDDPSIGDEKSRFHISLSEVRRRILSCLRLHYLANRVVINLLKEIEIASEEGKEMEKIEGIGWKINPHHRKVKHELRHIDESPHVLQRVLKQKLSDCEKNHH